jgi:signal transduction histidine kinase/sugar lactone lactonase YvrE
MLIRAVQAAFFVLLWHCVLAQLGTNFQSITVNDGLAQNSVWDVVQDHRGYYWIATADGLNRFDGYTFKHYKHNPADSTTIAGITIFGFFIDSQQNLWVTHDRGVSKYNRILDQFSNVITTNSFVIGEGGGFIWLFNSDSKVLKADYDGNVVKELPFSRGNKIFGSVRKAINKGDLIFIPTQFGLLKINVTTDEVGYLDIPRDFQGSLILLNDSTLFCPGYSSYLFDIRTSKYERVDLDFNIPSTFSPTGLVEYNGEYLAGSSEGLFVIDPKTLRIKRHIQSFERGKETSFHYVQCLYIDKSGTLFIGTNGDGMKVSVPSQNKFPLFSTGNVTTDFTKSIAIANDRLVSGIFQHGIVVFDSYSSFEHISFQRGAGTGSVLAVFPFEGELIILANYNDLVLYDLKAHKELRRATFQQGVAGVAYPVIRKLGKDRWTVNSDRSLFSFDAQLQLVKIFDFESIERIQLSTHSFVRGHYWIGTTGGLMVLDSLSSKVWKDLLTGYYIKCITEASNGRVWVATTGGLFEFDGLNQIHKHDVSTGLPNDFIYGALEDKYGFIWISHNKGLTRINPTDRTYQHFGLKDGLQSNEFNTGSFYKDANGYIYFGGVGGINKIDPDRLTNELNYPQIAITQINVLDEALASDTAYNELTKLTLGYEQSTLSFDFAALDYFSAEGVRYSYRLEGYDPNWIESDDRHFARYANLPAGEYTFQVRATLMDAPWGDNIRSLRVHIAAPFWQMGWFYLLCGAVGLVLLVLVGRIIIKAQGRRLKQELEVQHKLEIERIRISRDLHDHVGAQLSYLITNMEWMADHPEQIDNADRKEQLKSLSEAGRQAVSTLRQTIWAISQQELSVEDFADRFKQFALKMVEFNPAIKLKFEENLVVQTKLSPAVALNLFRICQEAFNNMLKHAQATTVTVVFSSDDYHRFYFQLIDNGVGFDADMAQLNGHYGIRNMRARADESRAELTINSRPGAGTTLTLRWN